MAENNTAENSTNAAQNFVEQLKPEDVQSVSSNGVSVNLRTAADKKAQLELDAVQAYDPRRALFRADRWEALH